MSVYTDSYDRGLRDALEGRERDRRASDLGHDRRGYEHGYADGLERKAQEAQRQPRWLQRAAGGPNFGAAR